MAITVSLTSPNKWDSWGSVRAVGSTVALDSSYPYGGYPVGANAFGMLYIDQMIFADAPSGLSFFYNSTTNKIQAYYTYSPPLIWQENQVIGSVTANQFTLDYPPAYIFYASVGATPIGITDSAATLVANQMQPITAFTYGNRSTFLTNGQNGNTISVGYVTQAWKSVWDNLVQNEAGVPTVNVTTLTNVPCAIQSVRMTGANNSTNVTSFLVSSAANATKAARVGFAAGTLTFLAADGVTATTSTYIKLPASGKLKDRFINEEASAATANNCTPLNPVLLWSLSGQAVNVGATTASAIAINATLGANLCRFNLTTGVPIVQYNVVANSNGTLSYVWGRAEEIRQQPLEVPNGTDLSVVTALKVRAIGA